MTNETRIRINDGGDLTRFPWLGSYRLSTLESRLLADGLRHFQVFTDGRFPQDVGRQSLLAQITADKLIANAAPGLGRLLERVRGNLMDCAVITNLPTDRSIAPLLSLTLASSIGSVFNYGSGQGDRLVTDVTLGGCETGAPGAGSSWQTEGALIPRERRAEWICMLGVEHTPGSYTAYAPIGPVERVLSTRVKAWLNSPSACFRPHGAETGAGNGATPRAILSRSPLGQVEVVWPADAVCAAKPGDAVLDDAMRELSAEFDRQHVRLANEAGCFLALNNLRGLHRHALASDGYQRFYKTYARQSLRVLQEAGEPGPIFAAAGTQAAQQAAADIARPSW